MADKFILERFVEGCGRRSAAPASQHLVNKDEVSKVVGFILSSDPTLRNAVVAGVVEVWKAYSTPRGNIFRGYRFRPVREEQERNGVL